jgi:cell division protein FtsB
MTVKKKQTLRATARTLQREAGKLKRQVEKLQARNKELRQWINKLTNKNHPARRAGK